ncbi:angiopoietin-related protein 7 [Caerostris darwini]|uniref:Angiopoietin-related protein 7 n=1 Tax=Caerostris darwini TaxID=1538125 RepID=A0AAV4R7S1_9ARAC|nr:angiopoietin-related protein 7 [Caerostris darwini]
MILMLFSLLAFLNVQVDCENIEIVQLGKIIKELQTEMTELRRIRQHDRETIRSLQEKVHRYVEDSSTDTPFADSGKETSTEKEFSSNMEAKNRDSTRLEKKEFQLSSVGRQFESFNSQMSKVEGSKSDVRTETDFMHQELLRLSRRIEDIKDQNSKESTSYPSRVAIRWLQETVEGLRHEMKEMASTLNTSATLAEKQRIMTNFALLRSDIVALGHRMDSGRVDRERNTAIIKQLRQDVDEIRLRLQESAMGQQKLIVEVDALKEELREQLLMLKKRNLMADHFNKEVRSHGSGDKEHPRFRHSHWKVEVESLQDTVNNLEYSQMDLNKQMQVIMKNQAESVLKLNDIQKSLNEDEPADQDKISTNQRLNLLESLVNKTEQQTRDIQSRVNNITTSGITKLHGSTMQLFNALERLESKYDKTTDDIRKEISKLDYNLSQTQSDLEELRDREISSEQVISNMKNDINIVQSDMKSNHLRILLVQNAVLNKTFLGNPQRMQVEDARISALESQIQSLLDNVDAEKMEIEDLHRQVIEKADDKDLTKWERSQLKVRESILQFKEDIPRIKKHQEKLEQELQKFISQMPRDCSENSTLEDIQDRKSGTYLIRNPTENSATSTVKVFCDMDTSGGHWTLIQRRSKGDQDFNKDWNYYKNGFGDVATGDFWLGNEILHQLTTNEDYMLRIDLWESTGKYKYAEYNTFEVLAEKDNFRLVLAGYHGNASDAMGYHNGMAFSTPDRDHDTSKATHCANFYHSGWWYNHCQYVNINGRYSTGITWYDIDGQEWSELTRVEMKIKPRTSH